MPPIDPAIRLDLGFTATRSACALTAKAVVYRANWQVRAAAAADSTRIVSLLALAGLPVADLSEKIFQRFLVAQAGGVRSTEIVGAIGLESFSATGLLRSLVVDESVRGCGVGQLLVNALEKRSLDEGIQNLWLLTIDAGGFFASLGFIERARTEAPTAIASTAEFSDLCPGDAVLMSKTILATSQV